jgi:hypothetical protein
MVTHCRGRFDYPPPTEIQRSGALSCDRFRGFWEARGPPGGPVGPQCCVIHSLSRIRLALILIWFRPILGGCSPQPPASRQCVGPG